MRPPGINSRFHSFSVVFNIPLVPTEGDIWMNRARNIETEDVEPEIELRLGEILAGTAGNDVRSADLAFELPSVMGSDKA